MVYQVSPQVHAAIEYGVENIRRFHGDQMPEPMSFNEVRPGAFAGDRFTAIPSVACYVPRGKGSPFRIHWIPGAPSRISDMKQ